MNEINCFSKCAILGRCNPTVTLLATITIASPKNFAFLALHASELCVLERRRIDFVSIRLSFNFRLYFRVLRQSVCTFGAHTTSLTYCYYYSHPSLDPDGFYQQISTSS